MIPSVQRIGMDRINPNTNKIIPTIIISISSKHSSSKMAEPDCYRTVIPNGLTCPPAFPCLMPVFTPFASWLTMSEPTAARRIFRPPLPSTGRRPVGQVLARRTGGDQETGALRVRLPGVSTGPLFVYGLCTGHDRTGQRGCRRRLSLSRIFGSTGRKFLTHMTAADALRISSAVSAHSMPGTEDGKGSSTGEEKICQHGDGLCSEWQSW